jgi:hypothetical protein
MSLSSLALDPSWRDYYGMWNPYVEPQFQAIEKSPCHAPRLALIPDILNQVVPPSGKIDYNFHLVPGSIIWGFWAGQMSNPDMVIQITDVNLGHKFFQDPVTVKFLDTIGANAGRFPSYTLLPTPHPVTGDGLFTLEVWGDPDDVAALILGVAEVTDCQVK